MYISLMCKQEVQGKGYKIVTLGCNMLKYLKHINQKRIKTDQKRTVISLDHIRIALDCFKYFIDRVHL